MKEIRLTQGYVALVDDEDFERVNRFRWRVLFEKRKDGTIRNRYADRNVWKGKTRSKQSLHRFLLDLSDPKIKVDHKDHDGLNCCRSNLRIATNTENSRNARLGKNNKSGYKGVYWYKPRSCWRASIKADGIKLHLGYYTDVKVAARAYDEAAAKHFKDFANINFKPE